MEIIQPKLKLVRTDELTEAKQQEYLHWLQHHHRDPGLVIPYSRIEPIASAMGTCPLSVPDPWKPWHFTLPSLYLGITTGGVTSETPHHHPIDTTEVYIVVEGHAEVLCKFPYERDWQTHYVEPGDAFIAAFGVCHYWTWMSPGFCWVIKSPPRAGVGKLPLGKIGCQQCHCFGTICTPPSGFMPKG